MKWRCPECSRVFEVGNREPLLCRECEEAAKPKPELITYRPPLDSKQKPEQEPKPSPEPEPEEITLRSLLAKEENALPTLFLAGLVVFVLSFCIVNWEPNFSEEEEPIGPVSREVREMADKMLELREAGMKRDRRAVDRGEMLPSEFKKKYYP